ncbi:DinB family protein [Tenacibaculum xiamenense]|uniref:DinB family protein n=1 Tax=Tenacibaculum xiamenense TaxID=1261553 RepID=UPI00389626E4
MINRIFRDNGAIGAILDEYEKTIIELNDVIQGIPQKQLIATVDFQTKDEDCKSIQTILTHVVSSGYNYVIVIRKWLGESVSYKEKLALNSFEEYQIALQEMFAFNEQIFRDYPHLKLCEYDPSKKIKTRWGQFYDVEQLFEHAIVHILRHRRQIEKFKVMLISKLDE